MFSLVQMTAVAEAYQRKYGQPLTAALKSEVRGDFARASVLWVKALQDPAAGLEGTTEQEIEPIADDPAALLGLVDALLAERASLTSFLAKLDADVLREACYGFGTDDRRLISVLCSRSKTHLARVSSEYWASYDQAGGIKYKV